MMVSLPLSLSLSREEKLRIVFNLYLLKDWGVVDSFLCWRKERCMNTLYVPSVQHVKFNPVPRDDRVRWRLIREEEAHERTR